jgi:Ricin-type beta-trefoil lectin domain-like
MPFDGGFNGASSQISALQSFNTILMNTFGWSSSTAYAHEGFSGMNGRTDSAEYFYQADFQTVLTFAENNHLARFTFWALNRDRQCNPVDNNGTLSGTCSGVAQSDWDFTKIVVQFGGGSGGSGGGGGTGGGGTGPYYKLVNRNSGQDLDISGGSTANGGVAIQWPDNGGANQQWQEVAVNGGYKLVNRNSGLLLDDPGYATTPGTALDQWSDSNSSNQWWNLVSTGDGYYYLVNQSSGLYADVSGASTANGASVIEWSSTGGTNQEWQLVAV